MKQFDGGCRRQGFFFNLGFWGIVAVIMEKEMAVHSSVLAWRIPGVAEPGGLPSMGLHTTEVGHD